jgi:hypothetical protein
MQMKSNHLKHKKEISVGEALLGGSILGGIGADKAADKYAAATKAANLANIKYQREFAQHGIRWKVQDAIAAGIHPYYAMGAPTSSFNIPIQPTATPNTGNMLKSIGSGFNQYASIKNPGSTPMDIEMKTMNYKLLKDQVKQMEDQNKPPPLFIQAYDPNPNSKTYGQKVWIYNPDLEMEGIIPVMGTAYTNVQDAIKGLENKIDKAMSHVDPEVRRKTKVFTESLDKNWSILPEFMKGLADKHIDFKKGYLYRWIYGE